MTSILEATDVLEVLSILHPTYD